MLYLVIFYIIPVIICLWYSYHVYDGTTLGEFFDEAKYSFIPLFNVFGIIIIIYILYIEDTITKLKELKIK